MCVVVNVGLMIYNYLIARQYFQLRRMLLAIALQSLIYQRIAPIWKLYPDKKITADTNVHHDI
jgi:hypothetical protein